MTSEEKKKRPSLKERIDILKERLRDFIVVSKEGLIDFTALVIAMLTTTLLPLLIFLLIIIAALVAALIVFS